MRQRVQTIPFTSGNLRPDPAPEFGSVQPIGQIEIERRIGEPSGELAFDLLQQDALRRTGTDVRAEKFDPRQRAGRFL
jgi:hypothetical protein